MIYVLFIRHSLSSEDSKTSFLNLSKLYINFNSIPELLNSGYLVNIPLVSFLGVGRDSNPGPNNKLFVTNLSYDTEVSSLQEMFCDATDVYLPKNKETGEKRG